ncbi:NUDIX hydrolase [Macrococcus equipercicus]|uniref:NUDIX hydrolase n=1 Tax=Macrococcus equipercicus TaxID=69967 RepID=A0A9Q9BR40_9STAP|nr:NUDIX hydrolase [Macrococcus equipercicus]UTH14146.1 NUDIX hydrolase [Macrococcus equipercicus]
MKAFKGSAGICLQDKKLLMVLQGTADEEKLWSVPSGGLAAGETFEACCIREIYEETGYHAAIQSFVKTKETTVKDFEVTINYYLVEITGGDRTFHDPDQLIHDIAWIDYDRLMNLSLSFEEDRELLLSYLK